MPTASAVPGFYSKEAPAQRDQFIITGGTGSLRLLKPGIKATVASTAGCQAELWQPYLQATKVQIAIEGSNRKEKSCISSSHAHYNSFLGQCPGGEAQTLNIPLNSPSASPAAVLLPQRAAGTETLAGHLPASAQPTEVAVVSSRLICREPAPCKPRVCLDVG